VAHSSTAKQNVIPLGTPLNLQFKNPGQFGSTPCYPFGLEKNLVTRQESEAEIKNKKRYKQDALQSASLQGMH
jgi:hypothetical protein